MYTIANPDSFQCFKFHIFWKITAGEPFLRMSGNHHQLHVQLVLSSIVDSDSVIRTRVRLESPIFVTCNLTWTKMTCDLTWVNLTWLARCHVFYVVFNVLFLWSIRPRQPNTFVMEKKLNAVANLYVIHIIVYCTCLIFVLLYMYMYNVCYMSSLPTQSIIVEAVGFY